MFILLNVLKWQKLIHKQMYSFKKTIFIQGNYFFRGNMLIQGNYIHLSSRKYVHSGKLCLFNNVAFPDIAEIFIVYSTSFPSHFIIFISFIITISWMKYSYNSALFDWRMKKLLMSKVPDYNHCLCCYWYHRAKKYHPNRCPSPAQNLR